MSSVITTRTGRRVVPTPAAAAAAAKAAASGSGGSGAGTAGSSSSPAASVSTPAGSKPGVRGTRGAKTEEKDTPVAKDPAQKPSSPAKEVAAPDPQKRRVGLRTTRVSSGSAEESADKASSPSANPPPAKKLKATTPAPVVEPKKTTKKDEIAPNLDSSVEQALSKMFEETIADKQESEEAVFIVPETQVEGELIPPGEHFKLVSENTVAEMDTQVVEMDVEMETKVLEHVGKIEVGTLEGGVKRNGAADVETQQKNAVDSILSDDTLERGAKENSAAIESSEEIKIDDEDEEKSKKIDTFPSWNEQGCIVCNVDISIDDPTNVSRNHEKVKDFFLEFFSIGDQISMEGENAFPFCQKCAEDMESLLGINHKIEFMHKQFNKVRDSLAKKSIKTFLVRTKPSCLEEDAKTESYGFLDDEQKKSYKEQMFNLWKSRYELVQPGPKTPIMIRSMDSRGRVTVVRLNSQGQPIPEKFGHMKRFSTTEIPIGGIGRTVINGDDDGDGNGDGIASLDIYKCKECPKSFSAKAMLAYHSRIHSGELPFECDLCGKAFSVPHYLMTHMRSHTGEKPYKCTECGKGFAQRGGLVTHALVHTGAKPYSCQVCGKSFRQKYHLTQHNLIHSGVKPFSCEMCGKCFNVKMNLREHMRRHTGDRPYKCPYCTSIGFFRKKMLKDHIVKAHPQRPMPIELMAAESSGSDASRETVVNISADSNDSSHSADDLHDDETVDSILPDDPLNDEEAVK